MVFSKLGLIVYRHHKILKKKKNIRNFSSVWNKCWMMLHFLSYVFDLNTVLSECVECSLQFTLVIKTVVFATHGGDVVSTVTLITGKLLVYSMGRPAAVLCEVCMASSHSQKTCSGPSVWVWIAVCLCVCSVIDPGCTLPLTWSQALSPTTIWTDKYLPRS